MNKKNKAISTIKQILFHLLKNDFEIFKKLAITNYRIIEKTDVEFNILSFSSCGPVKCKTNNKLLIVFKNEIFLESDKSYYLTMTLHEEKIPFTTKDFNLNFFLTDNLNIIDEEIKLNSKNLENQIEDFCDSVVSLFINNLNKENILKIAELYSRIIIDTV